MNYYNFSFQNFRNCRKPVIIFNNNEILYTKIVIWLHDLLADDDDESYNHWNTDNKIDISLLHKVYVHLFKYINNNIVVQRKYVVWDMI